MDLKEARSLIRLEHLRTAASLIRDHGEEGFEWLYERTGRREPDFRYVVFEGDRFPTKAFGFLVAQIAAGIDRKANDMTVNEAAAPLRRFGAVEVRLDRSSLTPKEEECRKVSYHRTLARPYQARFRAILLAAYRGCAISKVDVDDAVEAAHVVEFAREGRNSLANGILLRCDLHSLFDSGDLGINPIDMTVHFSERCRKHYTGYEGSHVEIPRGGPSPAAFTERWDAFRAAHVQPI